MTWSGKFNLNGVPERSANTGKENISFSQEQQLQVQCNDMWIKGGARWARY